MNWFRDLRVVAKLMLSAAIMSFLIALVGYIGIRDIGVVNEMLNDLYKNETLGISYIKGANAHLIAHQRAVRNLVLASTDDDKRKRIENMKMYESKLLDEIARATPTIQSEEGKQLLANFWPAWKEYQKVNERIVALATSTGSGAQSKELLDLVHNESQTAGDQVDTILARIASHHEANGQKAYDESDAVYNSSKNLLLGIIIGALVIGVLFGTYVSRLLSKPIAELERAAGKVAGGDTNVSVDIASKDEIGKLGKSFNVMVSNIKKAMEEVRKKGEAAEEAAREADAAKAHAEQQSEYLSRSVESILDEMNKFSEGDLTVSLAVTNDDDIGKLFGGFNKSVGNIHGMIQQLQESIETTASAATQISSSTEELAAGVQEQSAQSSEVAAAVEEMTRTIIDNSNNASKTAEVATENGKLAQSGGEVVQETTRKMREISGVVSSSAATVEKLGASSQQISEIISVIDDIADQTNLLALNAAIEAARAGEQGKGFAVVADEVRKLAERTTQATKEIEGMIKAIQQETREAVESMKRGTKEVEEGMRLADEAGRSLDRIVSETQKSVDMINQIAAASEEQSATSEQISKNVEAISSVSNESAAGVSQIARSADDLNRQTETLRNLISTFKIDSSRREGRILLSGNGGNNGKVAKDTSLALDFDRAKTSHRMWKMRLTNFIGGKGHLDQKEAGDYHKCELGKWYYGEGARLFGERTTFGELGKWHADLHRTAAEIIRLVSASRKDEAKAKISDVDEDSRHVVNLLDDLKNQVHASA